MSGVCRPHPQYNQQNESLWWTLVTVNGDVHTKEEATVYVKELDLFVTIMLLEDTPAVLSLGKLCEDQGYTYHWTSGQKPRLIKNALTFSSQEAVTPTQHPTSIKSQTMSVEVRKDSSRESAEIENPPQNKDNEERSTRKLVAWSFSWITFRAASKSGIG